MAGHDQCRSCRRRPPKRLRRGGTGMQNFRGDQSNNCACDRPLEYRNRTTSNPSGIFSHRSGISTSLTTGTRPGGRRTYFWTAPGAPMCRPPWKGRTTIAKGVRHISADVRAPRARAHQRRPRHHAPNVFTACDQAFHVAGGGHVALLRHHGAQRRRRCNTGTGFRSTSGAMTRANGPGRPCERPRTPTATSA